MKRSSNLPVRAKSSLLQKTNKPAKVKKRPTPVESEVQRIAVKPINEILHYLAQYNIDLQPQDLETPLPYVIQSLYYILLEEIRPMRIPALQVERDQLKKLPHDKIVAQDAVEASSIYKEFSALLQNWSTFDIVLDDLSAPTRNRTQIILTTIVEFLTLEDEYSEDFSSLMADIYPLTSEVDEMEAELEELLALRSEMEPKSIQEELESVQLERHNEAIVTTLLQKRDIANKVVAEYQQLKDERQILKDDMQSVQYTLLHNLHEAEALKAYAEIDVNKYKSDNQQFQANIQACKSELDQLRDFNSNAEKTMSQYKNHIADASQCFDRLESFTVEKENTNRHKRMNNTITQEIQKLEAEKKNEESLIARANQTIAHHTAKIEQIKSQYQKKREAINDYFVKNDLRIQENTRIANEKVKEMQECEEERQLVQKEYESMTDEIRQETDMLQTRYLALSSSLEERLKGAQNRIAKYEAENLDDFFR